MFGNVLHIRQAADGVIGIFWIVPLIGFVAATWGFVALDPRWAMLALTSAALSRAMILLWWSGLNTSSAAFALLFNIAVVIGIVWQRQPHPLGR